MKSNTGGGPTSPTSPTSIRKPTRYCQSTAGASATTPATRCGTPTAPSSRCRPWRRCFRGARCRRKVRRQNSPACGPLCGVGAGGTGPARRAGRDPRFLIFARPGRSGTSQRRPIRTKLPPVRQGGRPPPIRRTAGRGSTAARTASHIEGWPVEEGRKLLKGLVAKAIQPEFTYSHKWAPKDLVIWDNRCVLHRGRSWDKARYRRVMHRTTVAGAGPTA